jgi:hypothetical protein
LGRKAVGFQSIKIKCRAGRRRTRSSHERKKKGRKRVNGATTGDMQGTIGYIHIVSSVLLDLLTRKCDAVASRPCDEEIGK